MCILGVYFSAPRVLRQRCGHTERSQPDQCVDRRQDVLLESGYALSSTGKTHDVIRLCVSSPAKIDEVIRLCVQIMNTPQHTDSFIRLCEWHHI